MNGIPSLRVEAGRPSRVRWRIVVLLMMYVAVVHFNRISMSVAGTEQIMPRYGISATTMGWVYSTYLILYTICMIPGGWLIDRFGPRAALMVVGFGSAFFVALTGLAGMLFAYGGTLILALFLVRGLLGVVTAPIHPGAARAVGFWIPVPAHSTANGLVVGALCIGISSTYFLFGSMSDWIGWPGAFVVSGVGTALLALLWTSYATDTPGQHPAVNDAERKKIEAGGLIFPAETKSVRSTFDSEPERAPASRPKLMLLTLSYTSFLGLLQTIARAPRSLVLLTLSYATVNYVEYLFFYWIQYYFEKVLGLDKTTGRLYTTLLTLSMGIGIVLGGWLSDKAIRRFGRRVGMALVPMLGMSICALGIGFGLLFSEDLVLSVFCFAVAMAAIGATEGPFWTSAIDIGGRWGGKAAAIMNTGGNGGGLLAPVITPYFAKHFGWQAGLGLAAVVCLLGIIPWFWINPTPKPKAIIPDND